MPTRMPGCSCSLHPCLFRDMARRSRQAPALIDGMHVTAGTGALPSDTSTASTSLATSGGDADDAARSGGVSGKHGTAVASGSRTPAALAHYVNPSAGKLVAGARSFHHHHHHHHHHQPQGAASQGPALQRLGGDGGRGRTPRAQASTTSPSHAAATSPTAPHSPTPSHRREARSGHSPSGAHVLGGYGRVGLGEGSVWGPSSPRGSGSVWGPPLHGGAQRSSPPGPGTSPTYSGGRRGSAPRAAPGSSPSPLGYVPPPPPPQQAHGEGRMCPRSGFLLML
jgi:hypothetical protein